MEDWNSLAVAYRASFATLCAGTVDMLLDGVLTGTPAGPLLDVGCGTGDLLAAARDRDVPVVGIDAADDMVAASSIVVPGRVARAALPDLPFADGSFPAVTANFVLNHVPDPRACARELARVTASGGRVAATIWPAGGAGWGPLVAAVLEDAGVVPLPSTGLPAHLDFPRTADGLSALLEDAGLQVEDACEPTWTWRPAPASLWAGIAGGVATPGQTYLAQDAGTRERVRRAFLERCVPDDGSGRMAFPCRAVLVVARR